MLKLKKHFLRRAKVYFFMLFFALALWYLNPIVTGFFNTVLGDAGDSLLNAWIVSWDVHALGNPLHFFDGNIFYPNLGTLAYSETLFPFALMGMPIFLIFHNAIATYNFAYFITFALSGFFMYLLALHLTKKHLAGFVAGVIFAFSGAKLFHLTQLQIYPLFYPLVFLFLLKFFEGRQTKNLVWFAVFVALSFYASVNMGLILIVALVVFIAWYAWQNRERRLGLDKVALALGGSLLMLLPFVFLYLAMRSGVGLDRGWGEVLRYSLTLPMLVSFERQNVIYSLLHLPQITSFGLISVFLGFAALASIVLAFKNKKRRLFLPFAAVGLAGLIFSLGPLAFGVPLPYYIFKFLPLFSDIRAPWRFFELVVFAASILAAFGIVYVASLKKPLAKIAPAILVIVLLVESFAVKQETYRHQLSEGEKSAYQFLAGRSDVLALVELPLAPYGRHWPETKRMVNSTLHWKNLFNGYSGTAPKDYGENVAAISALPDEIALQKLSDLRINYILVHASEAGAEKYLNLSVGERFDFGDVIVYKLANH